MGASIHSMTGFASRTFSCLGTSYKIELKTLNHRFFELKVRTPREWNGFESAIRSLIESRLKRGSTDFWVEKVQDTSVASEIKVNLLQAESAFNALAELRTRFQITEAITLRDLMSFPEVISKNSAPSMTEVEAEELKKALLKEVNLALDDLLQMRAQEGLKLQKALLAIVGQFKSSHGRFVELRSIIQKKSQEKIRKKIEQCFEAYATPDAQLRAVMETRIAQEISYAIEKSDIEEELTRFRGHVDQIETLLNQGGLVGKKLDFMFQELNREINTLGNKSQDLDVSQDVISLKMWVEQMREQSLNLE